MRIVFVGTPEFALPSLNRLAKENEVLYVVTQPDRPKGRGMKLTPSPVKFLATQLNIPVVQPYKVGEIADKLRLTSPDLIVVVAYGNILTQEILKIPKLGCINLHASLLPELRGPEPIAWSIILGKEKTGLTTMWMDEGVDTGDIIAQKEIEILPEDTRGSLEKKMSLIGADFLCETLKMIEEGKSLRKKQEGNPTYAPMIKKIDCLIDWSKSAREIHNLVRGLSPSPSAYTFIEGGRLKIYRSKIVVEPALPSVKPAEIVEIKDDEILVATGEGIISVLEIQPEGKRIMSVKNYLAGHSIKKGMKFG